MYFHYRGVETERAFCICYFCGVGKHSSEAYRIYVRFSQTFPKVRIVDRTSRFCDFFDTVEGFEQQLRIGGAKAFVRQ